MRSKKRGIYFLFVLFLVFFTSCTSETGKTDTGEKRGVSKITEGKASVAETPSYDRNTTVYHLTAEGNPYRMEYTERGFFYFEMLEDTYQFYFQSYEEKEPKVFCSVRDGYVRDFSAVVNEGKLKLFIYLVGEETCILEYDETGKECGKTLLDEQFAQLESMADFQACSENMLGHGNRESLEVSYVIAMGQQVFLIDSSGNIECEFALKGRVRRICPAQEGKLMILTERDTEEQGKQGLSEIDLVQGKLRDEIDLPSGFMNLFPFGKEYVMIFGDRVSCFADLSKAISKEGELLAGEEVLIDLEKQGLLGSQMQFLFGDREEIKIVSMDPYDQERQVNLFALRVKADVGNGQEKGRKETIAQKEVYAPDGRRYVYVAIPKDCIWQVDFHAKKYNQTSDQAFVKIEKYESLEDYLGKGNRPDVIMFHDQTEMTDFIQKNVLADLKPFFEENENYSLEDVIPKARELLGMDTQEGLYGMAGIFRLLLMEISKSLEEEIGMGLNAVNYLKWYDQFLTKQEISGIGGIDQFLYANIDAFYDENNAKAWFASPEFYELMRAYKDVNDHHKGKIDMREVQFGKGVEILRYAQGAIWLGAYGCSTDENYIMMGVPRVDGKKKVYMQLFYPMSILCTSDGKEFAFDFMMYYNGLEEWLAVGDTPDAYGKRNDDQTQGLFSVYQSILDEQIFESEKPKSHVKAREEDGTFIEGKFDDWFYTEEKKETLRNLIDSAAPTTKTQSDVFGMLLEEMDAYWNGNKDLESACEILQNRVELYLREQK